jgi:CheY-like chemotaxis protein
MALPERRVLVADDSITVRKLVEHVLEARGVRVLSAPSGTEAIEQIERERPDLVISDVVMPDKSGYDICTFVREHPELSSTPVLLISGVMNAAVREQAARVQSDGVIGKPFSANELGLKVDHLLALRAGGPGPTRLPPRKAVSRATATAGPATGIARTLKAWVTEVGAMAGVELVVVADRQGLLVEASGPGAVAPNEAVAAGLAACCAEASRGIGDAVDRGRLEGVILDFERGIVLTHYLGDTAILGVLLRDPAYLGKIRYLLKRAVVELDDVSKRR